MGIVALAVAIPAEKDVDVHATDEPVAAALSQPSKRAIALAA
ncbi:hypothetical protein SCH4B_0010 [Ruegeria sp. TrichCH4B]|nr:hypothetical protein SCH4B_0010 [Ruegeria sp. TrichCH4B]